MRDELTRREVLLKAAYVAPLIVTLTVMPSIASAGSPITPPREDEIPKSTGHHHNHWHPW